jgi:hypothetical protein
MAHPYTYIVTRLRTGRTGYETPQHGQGYINILFATASRITRLNKYQKRILLGARRPGDDGDHAPPLVSAGVQNVWLDLHSPRRILGACLIKHRDNYFTFTTLPYAIIAELSPCS